MALKVGQVRYLSLTDGLPACPDRVALLGIGNELNGDDAAGVMVIRRLQEYLKQNGPIKREVLALEGATAPENFTGLLRRFQPELIIMIDAAYLDEKPGACAWLDWQTIDGYSASTHGLPPSVLVKYLSSELNCRMGLIGIQPEHMEFDLPVSKPVEVAVELVADLLSNWIISTPPPN